MPRSRFVRPETKRLDISNGDWLLVKKRLNAGEERAAYARMYLAGVGPTGARQIDILQTGLALVGAYLLDWSLVDEDGRPVAIKNLSVDEMTGVLDGLDPNDFKEIKSAIEAHEKAMEAERTEEKKDLGGTPSAAAISPSPSDAAGASSGSEPSTETITNSSLN